MGSEPGQMCRSKVREDLTSRGPGSDPTPKLPLKRGWTTVWFAWVGLVVVLDGLGFKKACDGYQLFRVLARLGHSEGGSLLSKIMAHPTRKWKVCIGTR